MASCAETKGATTNSGRLSHDVVVMHVGEPLRVKPSEVREDKEPFYFLCNLDQNIAVIMKTVYLYKSPSKEHEGSVLRVIKDSLSRVLSYYYPLAGKLGVNHEKKLIVECTDEGVIFVEAKANCAMSDVLSGLDQAETLLKLVYDVPGANILEIPLMTTQITSFNCGGFAIGIAMNHCMADGISAVEFLNSWGRLARNLPLETPPSLDRTKLIPRNPPTPKFRHQEFLQLDDISEPKSLYEDQPMEYRSFVFDEKKIMRLKSMAMEECSGGVSKCSTFEVLTAFVWRARTRALQMKSNQQVKLLFAVDGRSKFNPPLPQGFFGNAIVLTYMLCTAGELVEKQFSEVVKQVQDAKNMVSEEYIRSAIDYFELTRSRPSLTATLLITTWSRLAFNAMDFGWGEAIYAGPVGLPDREVALFLPLGENRKGIIVHLGLPRSAMEALEELILKI